MKQVLVLFFILLHLQSFAQIARFDKVTPVCCYSKDFVSEFERSVLDEFHKGVVNHTALLLAIDQSMTTRKFGLTEKYFKEFCTKLKNRRVLYQTDISYLKHVFDLIQEYYLKEFQYNQSVDRVMFKGQFDCVSGTAFYALVLENIDWKFVIKETPLHVYLEVVADGNKILFETTNRLGFIINENRVGKLESQYAAEYSEDFLILMKKGGYPISGQWDKEVSMVELAGIQYFNKSSVAYTSKDYEQSLILSEKSYLLYPSARTKGLIVLALEALMSSKEISYKTKLELYKKYRS